MLYMGNFNIFLYSKKQL